MKREMERLMEEGARKASYVGSYITSDPKLLRGKGTGV